MENKVLIKYHSDYAKPMEQHGDLIDLRVCGLDKEFLGIAEISHVQKEGNLVTSIEYKKGSVFRVRLGIAMKLPKGKKANVYPRSSTRKNYGVILTNSVGQIDNNYNGTNDEWLAEFCALEDGKMTLGDRILQFEIVDAMPQYEFEECDRLEDVDRGGYGSSGK